MEYDRLVRRGREIVADLSRNKWALGDLALEVAPIGRDGVNTGVYEVLDRFAEDIGITMDTLREYRSVSAAWPAAARASATYTAHRELRSHPDRFSLIADGMTVSEARAAAGKVRRTCDPQRDAEPAPREVTAYAALNPETGESMTIVVTPSELVSETPPTGDVDSYVAVLTRRAHRSIVELATAMQRHAGSLSLEACDGVKTMSQSMATAISHIIAAADGGDLDAQLRDLIERGA